MAPPEKAEGDPKTELIEPSQGGTFVDLAILGAADARGDRAGHVVSVRTEHTAVLDPCRHLGSRGTGVTLLGVDRDGLVDASELASALREDTYLVSVMAANNEIGVLQPIGEIGALCRERGVLFHSDAAQAAGRIDIDVERDCIDLLSVSGHKIYGPKGIGVLCVRARRPRARIAPRQFGGGHERGLRPGTLPVPLIVGLARALELMDRASLRSVEDKPGVPETIKSFGLEASALLVASPVK